MIFSLRHSRNTTIGSCEALKIPSIDLTKNHPNDLIGKSHKRGGLVRHRYFQTRRRSEEEQRSCLDSWVQRQRGTVETPR